MANKKRIQSPVRNSQRFSLKRSAACVKLAVAGGLAVGSMSPVQAELPVPSAVWASMGQATRQQIGNHMQIDQQTDRAILNWQSFNIGKDNSVHFQQPSNTSIALNKIYQNDPSRILGALTANGQVYLVNRNGFLFGKDSRVDVRGLVASALDVSDEVFNQGITRVFSTSRSAAFNDNEFALRDQNGSVVLDDNGQPIKALLAKDANGNPIRASITLEEGAQMQSGSGGRILIIAPTITNKGSIKSDDGQAILAASTDHVYLQEATDDNNLRGLLVEVGTGGDVTNLGEISSRRGNVTLIGFAVNQKGKVSATTSINLNGTVRLLARESRGGGPLLNIATTPPTMVARGTTRGEDIGDGLGRSATVTFGENSRTEVLPELAEGKTAINEQVQPLSKIEVMGHKVHVRNGAEVIVPGGIIDMVATPSPNTPLPANMIHRNDSRILIESGAKLDVSGVATTVKPIESNIIEVELRLNQLKDSPLQRDGILFGKKILVDIRQGTPIADIQPDIDSIQRTLGERLAKGGEINLGSQGDVIVQQNAVLDISGGAVTYLGGFVTTTKLTSNGRVFDISQAHPSLKYDGIYGEVIEVHEKWGVRKVWNVDGPFALARREAGYIEGHDAGRLTIRSPNTLFEGELKAGTASGRLQRTLDSKAHGGRLLIDMRMASAAVQSVIFSSARDTVGLGLDLDDPFPSTDRNLTVALALQSGLIGNSGVRDVSVLTNGVVEIAAGNTVKLADGGNLSLQGGRIDVNGSINGAGATVDLTTALNAHTRGLRLDGSVNINRGATITLQGGWVNDRATPVAAIDSMPVTIDGGRFSAVANGNVNLRAGSLIDVGGGAWRNTGGEIKAGNAGSIRLVAAADNTGSNIVLDGTLKAYALANGGSLELEANAVAIRRKREEETEGLRPLQIQEDFFGQGGFANYSIKANINGLVVDEGVRIRLQQVNRLLIGDAVTRTNADSIDAISRVAVLPAIQRAPSVLTLMSDHSIGPNPAAHLEIKQNASIVADPLSSVALISDSSLYFDGSITARGGDVTFSIVPWQGGDALDPMYQANQGIWLGDNARIDVTGIAITAVDALGRRTGEVYDGGSVTLDAQRGFVATKAGSRIDASGTAAFLNLPRRNPNGIGLSFDPVTVGSHGGLIEIKAAEGLFAAGSMSALAGNAPGASGGRLALSLDALRREPPPGDIPDNFPRLPGIMNVTQQSASLFSPAFNRAGNSMPAASVRQGNLSAEQVRQGGFASLAVQADNEIRFRGDVDLSMAHALKFDTPTYTWQRLNAADTGRVSLSAAHVSLGSSRIRTALANPTNGDGRLTVNGDLIELYGGTYTAGFNRVDFNAASDIRLRGIRIALDRDFIGDFRTFGALNLTAGQVYTTTLSNFALRVQGRADGKVTINGRGGAKNPVLSTHSRLTVIAPHIEQNGTVKAPFGEIEMTATHSLKFGANSVTSVSGDGLIVPFGLTEGGLEWLYPIGNRNLIVEAPNKKITFKADKIQRDEGALIDLSGGGDLLAYEFVPGIGGSRDVLATSNSFAVIPNFSGYSPFDPNEFPASGLSVGDSVFLGAGSGLQAGFYTLLPARYALLPGAFLVTPQPGTRDKVPGTKTVNLDGAPVVAGYVTVKGTPIKGQRWGGFAVEPGSIALTRSQLDLTSANQFFAQKARINETSLPRLPQDAGHVIFDAKTQLDLPAIRAGASNGGLAGLIDIVADNLEVVNFKNGATNTVQLAVGDLDKLEVGSLLLGAVRSFDNNTGSIKLDVKSKTVTLREETVLEGLEILLAATDKVELNQGASVVAKGKKLANVTTHVLETTGDGALLRVSTGAQAIKKRTGTQGQKGDLIINDGALVSSTRGSVLLDSTRRLSMNGQLEAGKSLNIGAEAIHLGEVDGSLPGLSLDNRQLSALQTEELVLTSRGNINLHGNVYRTDADGIADLDDEGRKLPINFGHLLFDAAGIVGINNAEKTAALSAETLTLRNSAKQTAPVNNQQTGELLVKADHLLLGGGDFSLSGFNKINFNLNESLMGLGETKLTAWGDLEIKTAYVTGAIGSKTTVNSGNRSLLIEQAADMPQFIASGFAGEFNLQAGHIDINAPLLFNSGIVRAEATTGDVRLGEQGRIDVSGAIVRTGLSGMMNLPAGQIDLTSKQGKVLTDRGSRLLLTGHTGQTTGGKLTVNTPEGEAIMLGLISAHCCGLGQGGQFVMDSRRLSETGISGLSDLLTSSGFTGSIDLRLRNGDLTLTPFDTLKAHQVKLTVDNGDLTVGGTIDSAGNHGGSIALNASGNLRLASGAVLNASADAENGKGGKVVLSSIDGGGIRIDNGALIDVSGNGGESGEVHLRADRRPGDVNISAIAPASIVGAGQSLIEAVQVYNFSNINAPAITRIKRETDEYMMAVSDNVGLISKFGPGFEIAPGIEVRSNGNMTLSAIWDFVDWRYGSEATPGILTLRAVGDVIVNRDLTDAFKPGAIPLYDLFGMDVSVSDMLQTGRSWSYNIVAGAANSADAMRFNAGSGDIRLANNVKVRTGTGDIALHAGRDLVYGNNRTVVYTAGRPDELNRYGFSLTTVGFVFYAEYPIDGGDVSFSVGRDIRGAVTDQFVTDWLVRTGQWDARNIPTAWGVAFSGTELNPAVEYRQNVGALGGGNIHIEAGRNISDLSVVLPTTGKQIGEPDPSDDENRRYLTNVVEVNGGGNLSVLAGNNIAGGMFYADQAQVELRAGGSLTGGGNRGRNPILALGDAQFNITAVKDVRLEAIVDPMVLPQGSTPDLSSIFFRYGPESAISIAALTGDVVLRNNHAAITNAELPARIYPGTLRAFALNGDLQVEGSMILFPSTQGHLELYAANNIGIGNATGPVFIVMSDANPALLPSISRPEEANYTNDSNLGRSLPPSGTSRVPTFIYSAIPNHLNNDFPTLISTGQGDIRGGLAARSLTFVSAKPALVQAGNDIRNTTFRIQHNVDGAQSIINAGRDIKFDIPREAMSGTIQNLQQTIQVSGPGHLTILAGRDVDLGSSDGISTVGNLVNPALAEDGASIDVIAGLAQTNLDVVAFASRYSKGDFALLDTYRQRVTDFMRRMTGDETLSEDAALAAFKELPAVEQAGFNAHDLNRINGAFNILLKEHGNKFSIAKNNFDNTNDVGEAFKYKQAMDLAQLEILAAKEILFPGTTVLAEIDGYSVDPVKGLVFEGGNNASSILEKAFATERNKEQSGDISMFFSKVHTTDGGDINLYVPNGGVNAGLAVNASGAKPASELGVVAVKQGAIHAIVRDDFQVNTTRVMTLGGGDIVIGSTDEDIDAGRGAKTALAAPPPITRFVDGIPVVEFPPAVAGSGIRANIAPDGNQGDALLFAFKGIIDAAEAGVGGKDVTVGATAIVGADNIDVGGVSIGVPAAAGGSIAAGLGNVGNVAAAVQQAVDSSTDAGKDVSDKMASAAALGIISIDIVGFGNEEVQ